ncbi:MAG: sulfite exporter TauE/SafE family protein [Clostridia bacterium]|nr:sulfite exporter TauE/SafE family protein [Clostridia bacterium]
MNGVKKFFYGYLIGGVNILLGAGGGMLTVPLYKKMGMTQKEAQINAVATILPISTVSAFIYIYNGDVKISDAYIYLIPGLIGSVLGTFFIKKISNNILTIIFSVFIIWAGVRLLFK